MKLYLLLPFSLLPFFGFSNAIDSLKHELLEADGLAMKIALNTKLATSFLESGFADSALQYNLIAGKLAESKSENYPYGEPQVFIDRVLIYFRNQNFKAAKAEVQQLFKETSKLSNRNKRELYENYSNVLILEEKSEEAIKILQKALDIAKVEGKGVGRLYMNLGAIFYDLRNNEKARYYYSLALNYDDINRLSVNYNIVASLIQDQRFDEALALLQTIVRESDMITLDNHRFFNLIGYLYLLDNDHDQAIQFLAKANTFIESQTKDVYSLMDNHVLLGNAYLEKYKITKEELLLKKAKHHLTACLEGAEKAADQKSQLESYSALIEVLIYQRNEEASITSFISYKTIRDNLFQKEKNTIVEELDVKYNVSEKQKEIALLKAEKITKELDHQKDRNGLTILISISILMTLVLLFLYFRTKAKKKGLAQELHIESLNKRELKSLLTLRENELNNNISLILEKNKLIQALKHNNNSNLDDIVLKFEQRYISDKEWGDIQIQFDFIYDGLIDQIQNEAKKLTPNDIKLFILLKLRYSNASMSEILNISYEGVRKAKQRLGKKVNPDILAA